MSVILEYENIYQVENIAENILCLLNSYDTKMNSIVLSAILKKNQDNDPSNQKCWGNIAATLHGGFCMVK